MGKAITGCFKDDRLSAIFERHESERVGRNEIKMKVEEEDLGPPRNDRAAQINFAMMKDGLLRF